MQGRCSVACVEAVIWGPPCPMARHCRRTASQPPPPACNSRCQGPPSLASCTCFLSLQQHTLALMMAYSASISAVCKTPHLLGLQFYRGSRVKITQAIICLSIYRPFGIYTGNKHADCMRL